MRIFHIINALALAPEDGQLYLALGLHHIDNAQLQVAMENFKEHLRFDPSSQTGHLYLSRTYDFLGDLDAAEKQLIRTIALSTDQVEPHLQLGRVLLRNYKLEQAAAKFNQVNDLDSGNILAEIGAKRVEAILAGKVPIATQAERSPASIVCIKQGKKYSPEYVNRLHAMVMRNSTLESHFVCFTDDASGLNGGIYAKPLPDRGFHGWWNKVSLFKGDLGDVGERLLYLDLDVVITNNIDVLLTYDSDFAIMDNDYVPGFNTSVFLLKTGSRPEIRDDFNADVMEKYDGDQDWVATMAPDAELWPPMWCVPFRLRAAQSVPENTKVVAFSGRPNPGDYPANWISDYWW